MIKGTTVIIPTYNRSAYIGEAIESISNQTLPVSEIIVVDDGSKDATCEVISKFRVTYIYQENKGKAAALNRAMQEARGGRVWIFDDDDVAKPDAHRLMSSALDQHERCGFAYGDCESFSVGPNGTKCIETQMYAPPSGIGLLNDLLIECRIFQPGLLVRRECYDEVGEFNEKMLRAQDYEMLLRLAHRYSGIHVGAIMFSQRQHSASRGTAAFEVKRFNRYEVQTRYDQIALTTTLAAMQPTDYRTFRDDDTTPSLADPMDAALFKAVVLARKGLWQSFEENLLLTFQSASQIGRTSFTQRQRSFLAKAIDGSSAGLPSLVLCARKVPRYRGDEHHAFRQEVCSVLHEALLARLRDATVSRKPLLKILLISAALFFYPKERRIVPRLGALALRSHYRLRKVLLLLAAIKERYALTWKRAFSWPMWVLAFGSSVDAQADATATYL